MLNVPEIKAKPPIREVLATAVSKMDLVGLLLLWPAATMFFLALQWGGIRYAWSSSHVIGLFAGAATTFIALLYWEYRSGDDALLPFSTLRVRIIYSASATMFFFMGVMFVQHYYLPIYFQAVKNDSPLMSGVHILPTIISQVILAMLSGTMSKYSLSCQDNYSRDDKICLPASFLVVQKLGYYLPWVLSGTTLSTIAYGLYSMLRPATSTASWVGYQFIGGVGNGAAVSSVRILDHTHT